MLGLRWSLVSGLGSGPEASALPVLPSAQLAQVIPLFYKVYAIMSSRSAKAYERQQRKKEETLARVNTMGDRVGIFRYQGTRYHVHRLNTGEYVVMKPGTLWCGARIFKHPPPKLIDKARRAWADDDLKDLLDS